MNGRQILRAPALRIVAVSYLIFLIILGFSGGSSPPAPPIAGTSEVKKAGSSPPAPTIARRYADDSYTHTSTCNRGTRMAVHIVHFRAIGNATQRKGQSKGNRDISFRSMILRDVMRPLAMLPFSDVAFFVHTNRAMPLDDSLSEEMGEREVSVIVHKLKSYEFLGWAVRFYINATWHDYDIVLFMEDDLKINAGGILDYWCQYKDIAYSLDRHLNFLMYEMIPDVPALRVGVGYNYSQGLMTELSHAAKFELNLTARLATFRKRAYAYIPLWIVDKNRMRRFVGSREFFHKYHNLHGYNPNLLQEGAFISVRTTLNARPTLGMMCSKEAPPSEKNVCTLHPGAYIHHMPNNYADGSNEKWKKQNRPQSLEYVHCLTGNCPPVVMADLIREPPRKLVEITNVSEARGTFTPTRKDVESYYAPYTPLQALVDAADKQHKALKDSLYKARAGKI